MEIQNHWLVQARRSVSPNQDHRPRPENIDLLVIHNISLPPGELETYWITRFFLNDLDPAEHPYFEHLKEVRVSAHLLIDRLGGITQFVGFDRRAWHAGDSSFEGRKACNDFSIGIELIGADDLPYTDRQYTALAFATAAIMHAYPSISLERVVGHSNIAPGRKTDPGASFDWQKYRELLEGAL